MPLKLKLWLGRITDWDKDSVRLLLFILVINLAIFGAIVVDQVPLGRSGSCNAECKAEVDLLIDRAIEQHFRDPDRVIDDALRDAR